MLCKYNNKSRRKKWLVGLQNTNASLEVMGKTLQQYTCTQMKKYLTRVKKSN